MLDWLDAFANTLGDNAASIWAALSFLFGLIVAVAQFLLALLQAIWNALVAAIKAIAKFLVGLWNSFFKKLFVDLLKAIRAAHNWLESHLGPFLKWMQQARAWLDRMFRLYIKPFLNMLQHVRQYLQILRLMGVKWAGALDARLGQIEGRIAGIFLEARAILTGFIDIANALADPLNLFRRPTLVLSIRRILPSLVRVTTGLPMGYFLPSPRKNAAPGLGPTPLNFDPGNPAMNPPASEYFSNDDGLGTFAGFADGTIPDDGAVDDLSILDYFDDGLYDTPLCQDPVHCLTVLQTRAFGAVATGTPA